MEKEVFDLLQDNVNYTYFNKKSGYAFILLLALYLSIDLLLIDYSSKNAYSIAVYLKLVICIFFMGVAKETKYFFEDEDSIMAAADMSILLFCVSLIFMSIFTIKLPLSKYVGIVLIIGIPFILQLTIKSLNYLNSTSSLRIFNKLWAITLKLLLVVYICIILIFFTLGEWRLDLKNISELFSVSMM